jgi:hypothetical protein
MDNKLYAVNSAGFALGIVDMGTPLNSSVCEDSNRRIYFGGDDGRIYARFGYAASWWSYATGNAVKSSPAFSSSGHLYVGSNDSILYALTSAGAKAWTYCTGDSIVSSPAVGADGFIYFGSNDNSIYSLDPDGTLAWSYITGGNVVSSPSIGPDGRLCVGSYDQRLYVFDAPPPPTPTPQPNYVDLHVANGPDFSKGDILNLDWASHEDQYGFAGVPCRVYLGAALDPPAEDTDLTVQQIVSSRALYLFDSKMRATRYNPRNVMPTWSGVRFPVPNIGSSGILNFKVPGGAAGRWVFATAFVRMDNGQFPAEPPVEVSNGVTVH